MKRHKRVPYWMLAVIVIVAMPVLAFPALLSVSNPDTNRFYLWLYPAYVVSASLLAWQCYGRRTEMTWIILILMLLTHAAMWVLVKEF